MFSPLLLQIPNEQAICFEVLCCHISLAIAVCFLYHNVYLLRRPEKKSLWLNVRSSRLFSTPPSCHSQPLFFSQWYFCNHIIQQMTCFFAIIILATKENNAFFQQIQNNSDLGLQSSTVMRPLALQFVHFAQAR